LFFFFYRNSALSSRREAARQMYNGGSLVGMASFFHSDVSSIPCRNFYWEAKVRNLA